MMSKLQISVFVAITALAWIGVLLMRGTALSLEYLLPYGIVVSIVSIIVTVFEKKLWASRFLRGWFVTRPDLRGSWHVELESDWIDPNTGRPADPITGYMIVRQTLTTLSMRMMTPESSSWLTAHNIVQTNDGVLQLMGVYMNTPQIELRGSRSEIHYGSFQLNVQSNPPSSLEGHYWTDRKTSGSIRLTRRKHVLYSTYEEAHSGFDQ